MKPMNSESKEQLLQSLAVQREQFSKIEENVQDLFFSTIQEYDALLFSYVETIKELGYHVRHGRLCIEKLMGMVLYAPDEQEKEDS